MVGSPTPPSTTNLVFWLDADYQNSRLLYDNPSGTQVTADGSAMGFGIVDGASAVCAWVAGSQRPLLRSPWVNGHNALTFDGTDDGLDIWTRVGLSTNGGLHLSVMGASNWTYCGALLVRQSTIGSGTTVYQQNQIFGDQLQFMGLYSGNTGSATVSPYTLAAYVWDGAAKKASATGLNYNQWYVVGVKHDGSNIKIRVNGGSWNSTAAGAAATTTGTLAFSRRVFNIQSDIEIAQFIAYSALLSDADLLNVERYFGAKIGVSF